MNLDAHCSFSSNFPRLVMDRAAMNSRKSIVPFPFLSVQQCETSATSSSHSAQLLRGVAGEGAQSEIRRRTKHLEDMLRERLRVAEREELFVDPRKFLLVELAGGAVLDKALVPVEPRTKRQRRSEECEWGREDGPLLQFLLVNCERQRRVSDQRLRSFG